MRNVQVQNSTWVSVTKWLLIDWVTYNWECYTQTLSRSTCEAWQSYEKRSACLQWCQRKCILRSCITMSHSQRWSVCCFSYDILDSYNHWRKSLYPDLSYLVLILVLDLVDTSSHVLTLKKPSKVVDSMITLHWIKSLAKQWKPFVENRVRENFNCTCAVESGQWKKNPAGVTTRGTRIKNGGGQVLLSSDKEKLITLKLSLAHIRLLKL